MKPSPVHFAVEQALTDLEGSDVCIVRTNVAGGGCINDAETIELSDGRFLFLKSHPAPPPRMFECEAAGLAALRAPLLLRVPEPIVFGGGGDGVPAFLVMEHIAVGHQPREFQRDFGRRLAELHRATTNHRFGFPHDNYIGSTLQPNEWMMDWGEFWRERRLGFQLQLARKKSLTDGDFNRLGDRLMERLPELIGEPDEPACLLHGDLWGGNYLCDETGTPTLIDPATYYGRREADLAMTMLFGGFSREFYEGYEEVWALAPGSKQRLEVYKLYHLLNHLNLFGGGYREQCEAVMRGLV